MQPDIERFVKTLKLENTGHISIAELGIHSNIKQTLLGRPIKSLKDDVDFWYQAGYDYIKLQPGVDFNPAKIGVNKDSLVEKEGSLSYNWASEGKGVIHSEQSLQQFVFPRTAEFDYTKFEQVKALLPEGMGVIGQYGDIFTMTWEMMGFEGFSMALFENPDLIKQLNDILGNLVFSMFEYFAQSDAVDILWYSDDIAFTNGLLMSPEVLLTYFFPWLTKIGKLAKKYNKPLIYHTDGVLWEVFDDIMSCGVDAIHPIEPKAMDIAEVKAKYGNKLCLIGHVDVDLLARGTEIHVRDRVLENIKQAGYNGGYIVGSGNSIPHYVKFENYLAMLKTVQDFNRM